MCELLQLISCAKCIKITTGLHSVGQTEEGHFGYKVIILVYIFENNFICASNFTKE